MRIRMAFLSTAVLATVGMLAATSASAQDPAPPQNCTTSNGWSIQATGPTVGPCSPTGTGTGTCTLIQYSITAGPASTPDHVATFVRAEATITGTTPTATASAPCDGDSAIGMPSNVDCHENLLRWNSQANKGLGSLFAVEAAGVRAPIATSVVVKKGNSVGSCAVVGIGLATTSPLATTAPSLTESLAGGKCQVKVTQDGSGKVTHVTSQTTGCQVSGPFQPGDVTFTITANGAVIKPPSTLELSEGLNFIVGPGSCTWKQYYPPTGGIYQICY